MAHPRESLGRGQRGSRPRPTSVTGRAIGSTLASAGFGSLLAARLGAEASSPVTLAAALRDTFTAAAILLCLGAVVVLLLEEAPLRQFAARR